MPSHDAPSSDAALKSLTTTPDQLTAIIDAVVAAVMAVASSGDIEQQRQFHRRLSEELRPHEAVLSGLTTLEQESATHRRLRQIRTEIMDALVRDPPLAIELAIISRIALMESGAAHSRPAVQVATAQQTSVHGLAAAGRDINIAIEHLGQAGPVEATVYDLPPAVRNLTGREQEFEELVALLDLGRPSASSGLPSIVAVSGRPGVGKTALAINVAHGIRHYFPHGQLYIDMRGASAERPLPATLLGSLLRRLGIEGDRIPATLDERAALLRTTTEGRKMLLLLDNAADERQVRPLLPASSSMAVLITSRKRLTGLTGTRLLDLGLLATDDALALLERIVGQERIRGEIDSAREVVGRCGHLPLALSIVGARLAARQHVTIAELLADLLNEHGSIDLERLQHGDEAVRTSFSWSYQAIDPVDQQVFRRLSVLRVADFPAWVATVVSNTPTLAEDAAERLVEARIVEVALEDEARKPRYRLHDLLHTYAWELMKTYEAPDAHRSVLADVVRVYADLAGVADARLVDARRTESGEIQPGGNSEAGRWASRLGRVRDSVAADAEGWLSVERVNLVAVIEHAHEAAFWSDTIRLVGSLATFFELRAEWTTSQYCHELGLDAARRAGDTHAEARMLFGVGCVYRDQDRWDRAIVCFDLARSIFRSDGDRLGELRSQRALGELHWYQSRWDEAIECLTGCLAEFRSPEQDYDIALALIPLARVHRDRHEPSAALPLFSRAHEIFLRVGDRLHEAIALVGLAMTCRQLGQFDDAIEHCDRAVQVCKELQNVVWESIATAVLGDVLRLKGQLDSAARCFEPIIVRFRERGDPWFASRSERGLALVRRDQGRLPEARGLLSTSIEGLRELGDRRTSAAALAELSGIEYVLGYSRDAQRHLDEAQHLYRERDDVRGHARALGDLASFLRSAEKRSTAERYSIEALVLLDTVEDLTVDDKRLRKKLARRREQ